MALQARRAFAREQLPGHGALLIAHYFGMNPVSLLLSFGLIDKEDTPAAAPVVPPLAVITKREVKAKPRKKTPGLRGSSRF